MKTIIDIAKETKADDIHNEINAATSAKMVDEVLTDIVDLEIEDDDDDQIHEAADFLVGVYTSDLHDWIAADRAHGVYVSDAVENGLANTSSFDTMLMAGQYQQYLEIFYEVIEHLNEKLEDDEGRLFSSVSHAGDDVDIYPALEEHGLQDADYDREGEGLYRVYRLTDDEASNLVGDSYFDEANGGGEFAVNLVPEGA